MSSRFKWELDRRGISNRLVRYFGIDYYNPLFGLRFHSSTRSDAILTANTIRRQKNDIAFGHSAKSNIGAKIGTCTYCADVVRTSI